MARVAGRMLALVVAGLVAHPARLPAQDPWPVLDRANAAYLRARTFTADFVQVVANPMLGEPDTTRGRLYQQRPSRFAMRFTQPRGDRIVADGRWLWLYTPSTTPGQVIRSRIPEHGTTGPNLIGQFVDRARERYSARYVRADSTATGWIDVVALTPRDSSLPYSGAVLWVSRRDGLVHRLEITEGGGQQRVVILSNLEENVAVAAREFTSRLRRACR
jgi:outer membrane lipoprotein carrier protein